MLVRYIKEGRIKLDSTRFDVLTTFHDPCNCGRKAQMRFGHGYFEQPRWILDQCMPNWVDLYPNRMDQICCGGGGGTLVNSYDDERSFYVIRKIDQIRVTGARMIVVPCHSCHGQFNSIKKQFELEDVQVKYLWELVADCLVL